MRDRGESLTVKSALSRQVLYPREYSAEKFKLEWFEILWSLSLTMVMPYGFCDGFRANVYGAGGGVVRLA